MKSFIVSMLLLSATAMANINAQDMALTAGSEEASVEFIAWCEDNSVMTQDSSTGKAQVIANCSEQNLTCKPFSVFRMGKVIYSATCSAQ